MKTRINYFLALCAGSALICSCGGGAKSENYDYDMEGLAEAMSKYGSIGQFNDGLAAVNGGGVHGYINPKGELVFTISSEAEDFENGVAIEAIWDYDCGNKMYTIKCYDKKGKVIYDVQTGSEINKCDYRCYCDGVIPVQDHRGYWGLMNSKGEARFWLKDITKFHEGLALAEDMFGDPIIVDTKGKYVDIKTTSDYIYSSIGFKGGIAVCDSNEGSLILDKKGNVTKIPGYSIEGNLGNGLVKIKDDYGDYGVADASGRILHGCDFAEMGYEYEDGMLKVCERNYRSDSRWDYEDFYGFLDLKGNLSVECKYKEVNDFSEGYATVKTVDGKYGVIDKNGKVVIPLSEEGYKGEFHNGLAYSYGRKGYINPKGEVVISAENYTSCEAFHNGLAKVEVYLGGFNYLTCYINTKGEATYKK